MPTQPVPKTTAHRRRARRRRRQPEQKPVVTPQLTRAASSMDVIIDLGRRTTRDKTEYSVEAPTTHIDAGPRRSGGSGNVLSGRQPTPAYSPACQRFCCRGAVAELTQTEVRAGEPGPLVTRVHAGAASTRRRRLVPPTSGGGRPLARMCSSEWHRLAPPIRTEHLVRLRRSSLKTP